MGAMQRYVSKELTHFVGRNLRDGDKGENQLWNEQYNILLKIIKEKCISYPPHKTEEKDCTRDFVVIRSKFSSNNMIVPGMVCFCDIPIDDLSIHISKYSHFGLSFQKAFLIGHGATPVFYVEKNSVNRNNPTRTKTRSDYFDQMVEYYINYCNNYLKCLDDPHKIKLKPKECVDISNFMLDLLRYIKFFDTSKPDDDKDNFYMEREWRCTYYIRFKIADICRIILPSSYSERFRNDVPGYFGQITFSDEHLG